MSPSGTRDGKLGEKIKGKFLIEKWLLDWGWLMRIVLVTFL